MCEKQEFLLINKEPTAQTQLSKYILQRFHTGGQQAKYS